MCYFNTNLCDLHPTCDNAEDEDEKRCAEKYKEKGLFKKEATFRCQSPHHNEDSVKANLSRGVVWIKAVPQDGIKECWKGQDEDPTPSYLAYGLPGSIRLSNTNMLLYCKNILYILFSCLPCRPCDGLNPCRSNTEALLWNG